MNMRWVSGILFLVLLFMVLPNVASQEDFHYDLPPRLYIYNDEYSPRLVYQENIEDAGYQTLVLGPYENITLSIQGVENRIFNPDVKIRISLDPLATYSYQIYVAFQIRFDGNGDGEFEYIVHFNDSLIHGDYDREIVSSYRTGQPMSMTHGTIELYMERKDQESHNMTLEVNRDTCYIQIPFDLDTDGDGVGDYSDSDDDNDGHLDYEDMLPKNKDEWKDSDGDGIGDNADPDDNDNGVPDDFELPIAFMVILLPILIILAVMKRVKKKSGGNNGSTTKFKPFTTSKSGPKNW